jgi:glycosyltransferase involved in cell wall biosynthesis
MKSNVKVAMLAPASFDGAGVYFATNGLVKALIQYPKMKVEIFSGMKIIDTSYKDEWKGVDVKILKAYGPNNFLWAPGMKSSILKVNPDLIHLHGLWMYQSYITNRLKNIPKIISPHGMLNDWPIKNSFFKKKLALYLYELNNLKSAHCLHALNENEFESIRNFGLQNPVAIIPNGVDFHDVHSNYYKPYWLNSIPKDSKVLLFLGRIHKKKGIESLLISWKRFIDKLNKFGIQERWSLVIAGDGQHKYVDSVKKLQLNLGIEDTSFFVGPVSGKVKESTFHNSDAFILPSYSEGLPMAVLEACSFKLPVLLTNECNLNDILECKAGIKIESHNDFSDSLIELANKSDAELIKMGTNGCDIVKKKYGWTKVSAEYYDVCQWLSGNSSCPEFVITS